MTDRNTTKTPAALLLETLREQVRTGKFVEADDKDYFNNRPPLDQSIVLRTLVERAIVRQAVKDLIAAGLVVSMWDGDSPVVNSNEVAVVMAEIGVSDEQEILVCDQMNGRFNLIGSIILVYGNDGWDVIADNYVALEKHLQPAESLAEALCDAMAEVF